MNATLGQEMEMNLWDYDPGFPGVQNDDFLGRCGGESVVLVVKGVRVSIEEALWSLDWCFFPNKNNLDLSVFAVFYLFYLFKCPVNELLPN